MKHKKCWFTLLLLMLSNVISAQNPISPPGLYIADPTARVWDDGNLYIYGSLDKTCGLYCSHQHHVLYTNNLLTWQLRKDIFRSEGFNDEVPYNDNLLFAPSIAFRDGNYYLYYCQPDPKHAEGVAFSKQPTGPFTNGTPINTGRYNQIDPDVFIDDDGDAYYCWGQFSLKMAKMNDDMVSLDSATIRDNILTEDEHHFHEGAFMCKINGVYYMIFADISRGDTPTCIGYATSEKPFGPYRYRGVIVDNDGCNPNNWNNHGSVVEFKDQYYVVYHRSTHACNKMRKACMEPIEILSDGTIPEVEMTSQGPNDPLEAKRTIEAEWACLLFGNARIVEYEEGKECVTGIHSGDKLTYKYLDFKSGMDSVQLRIKSGISGGRLVIGLEQPWHRKLASIDIEPNVENAWTTMTLPLESTQGIHQLWLMFSGENDEILDIDWFRFK